MFGTLVICLPSAHTGGMLRLAHHGKQQKFDTAQSNPSYAAWYLDVTHEVEEVTSGYRLVLTYNLVQTGPRTPYSASLLDRQLYNPITKAVKDWSASCENEGSYDPAVYLLEHQYTDVSLSFETLKGADVARAHLLNGIAHQQDMVVFLAKTERMQSGQSTCLR